MRYARQLIAGAAGLAIAASAATAQNATETDSAIAKYQRLIKRFPRSARVRYELGALLDGKEDPRARAYLLDAVRLDPHLAAAYEHLSFDAERWGNMAEARQWMAKAVAADTTNPEYAFYAINFEDSDAARRHAAVRALEARFPTNERAMRALSFETYFMATDSERIAQLEHLRIRFPLDRYPGAAGPMHPLFDAYVRQGSPNALSLAEDLLRWAKDPDDQKEWAQRVVYARNIALATSLMAEGKRPAAEGVLSATLVPKYSATAEYFALLRAAAADSQQAYDSLLAYQAREPTDAVAAALRRAAEKLGQTPGQTDSAVWALRDRAATPAAAFKLRAYASADSVSLADYRGRVVLLTFWFPGCGPCRGEFPYMQAAVDKFRSRGLAYVAINTATDQNAYVLPFIRGYGYSFTALEGSHELAAALYHVRGEPTNFLIDPGGRIVFTDFYARDPDGQRALELMLTAMFDHTTAGGR